MIDNAVFNSVVIRDGLYRGWVCSYAGLGRLVFVKGGREVAIEKDGEGWLYAAWEEARQRIDGIEDAAAPPSHGEG